MKTKVCTKCKVEKELSEFHKQAKAKDNLQTQCKVCRGEKGKAYRQIPEVKQYRKEYLQKNKEHKKEYDKKRYKQNREQIIQSQIEYSKKRYHSDLQYRITNNLRSRLRKALKGLTKSASTLELLGCSIEHFREHLESQFQEGMTFENYGDWHIDHIRPCVSFDLKDPEQQKQCFHYTNLQP